jgi:DNA-binding PadR family transcriptional regulator
MQDFDAEIWMARRPRHRRRGRGFGGGRHGGHDRGGDDIRAGRMLAQGDLRLIMLALIADQPRHGYEIIKVIEEKTGGWYTPSPGIIYPTLTFLEEADYVRAQMDGAKKLYSITPEGRAHLKQNRELADLSLDRLAVAAARYGRLRRAAEVDQHRNDPTLPPLVRAAIDNLRAAAVERLTADAADEPRIVDTLARAAVELRRK